MAVNEILTPEEALKKFPEYIRAVHESHRYNYLKAPLVTTYHHFTHDPETWDIDQWTLVYSSYGVSLYVMDIWRQGNDRPEVSGIQISKDFFKRMQEVV